MIEQNLRNCQPMRLLRRMKKSGRDNYFYILDEIRERYDEQPYWPKEKVWVPVNAVMNIAQREHVDFYDEKNATTLYTISSLAGWRQAKNIYTMAPELTEVLYEQADKNTLSMSVQTINLPVWTVYIQPNSGETAESGAKLDGFFAYWDYLNNQYLLRFVGVDVNGVIDTPIILTIPEGMDISIEDCIQQGIQQMKQLWMESPIYDGNPDSPTIFTGKEKQIHRWVSLLLYLSAVNTDIRHSGKGGARP